MDEWQISLGYVRGSNIYVRGSNIYVRGSNIYVRGYLDLRTWSLRLRA